MRLSMDGLTPISDAGMKDWFKDNLKLNNKIVGSYDDKKDEYNLSLMMTTENVSKSVTYKESIKGWVSFKSFVTQNGISCANDYFTFKGGKLWLHNDEMVDRNTFYNVFTSSSFEVVLNEMPGVVKSFYTLNYEGSQTKVEQNTSDDQYFNTHAHHVADGWYVDHIFTDKESGDIEKGFIEKEGKWFNYIKGSDVIHNPDDSVKVNSDGSSTWDGGSFAMQGLGSSLTVNGASLMLGCTDANALNFDPTANSDDGTCVYLSGCTEPSSVDYDPTNPAFTEDGSCTWTGCTDNTASNYIGFGAAADAYELIYPGAITDDGTCIPVVNGCTDPTASNYDPTATDDDGSCVYVVEGCMELLAVNYDSNANTDDAGDPCEFQTCSDNGSDANYSAQSASAHANYIANVNPSGILTENCISGGCLDNVTPADNYVVDANGDPVNPLGNVILWDDGSCTYGGCTDPNSCNWDADATNDDGSCYTPCDWNDCGGVAHPNPISLNSSAEVNSGNDGKIILYPNANALFWDGGSPLVYTCTNCPSSTPVQVGNNFWFTGLSQGWYTIEVTSSIPGNTCMYTEDKYVNNVNYGCTDDTTVDGCGDGCDGANNYWAGAQFDDGSCTYTALCWGCNYGNVEDQVFTDVQFANANDLANADFSYSTTNDHGDQQQSNVCYSSPSLVAAGGYSYADGLANLQPDYFGNYVWTPTQNSVIPPHAWLLYGALCSGGCMDPGATNYDPLASFEDGSCEWVFYGDSPSNQGTDSCHVVGGGWDGSSYVTPPAVNSPYIFNYFITSIEDALCACCEDPGNLQENIEDNGILYGDAVNAGSGCCDYDPCGCSN